MGSRPFKLSDNTRNPPHDRGGEGGAAAAGIPSCRLVTLRDLLDRCELIAASDEDQLQLGLYNDLKPLVERHFRMFRQFRLDDEVNKLCEASNEE